LMDGRGRGSLPRVQRFDTRRIARWSPDRARAVLLRAGLTIGEAAYIVRLAEPERWEHLMRKRLCKPGMEA
jgi:hypothetical protein